MTDEAIKKRLARAKKQVIEHFEKIGYKIVLSDDKPFCFTAARKKEARMIRVVVDKITDGDRALVRNVDVPDSCSREIFCPTKDGLEIEEVEK